jgi:DNA-binding IclR family transcriptional regulator
MVASVELPPAPEYGALPQYPIDSVDNALRVLLLFADQTTIRVTDVSRYLGVATSTGHRLLAMLQYRGFVRQDAATRGYVPGPTLDSLAIGLLRRQDVRTRVRPVLERLNRDLGETVQLARLDGDQVHFIDSIESTRALRVGGRLGQSTPAHCTSTGKVLLAQLSDEEIRRLYPREELERLTPHSIASRAQLLGELARARARGYAQSREESEEGVRSLAVALRGPRSPLYAIVASVPVSRMTDSAQGTILARLTEAVEEIDGRLA